jgi:hypothetical protein
MKSSNVKQGTTKGIVRSSKKEATRGVATLSKEQQEE